MQKNSGILDHESETIELPEEASEFASHSPLVRAVFWVGMVMAGAAATYGMYFHNVAQAAGTMGAEDSNSQSLQSSAQLDDFLAQGAGQLRAMRASLGATDPMIESFLSYPTRPQVPLARLGRNPFLQPRTASPSLPLRAADTQQHQQAERAAMLQTVEALHLQSIMHSDSHRSCMINDCLYDEGGIVNGFTIEQINTQSVVIRNGLYRFELTMNR